MLSGLWITGKALIDSNQESGLGANGARLQKGMHPLPREYTIPVSFVQLWVLHICTLIALPALSTSLVLLALPALLPLPVLPSPITQPFWQMVRQYFLIFKLSSLSIVAVAYRHLPTIARCPTWIKAN